jgi:hypothetical protein
LLANQKYRYDRDTITMGKAIDLREDTTYSTYIKRSAPLDSTQFRLQKCDNIDIDIWFVTIPFDLTKCPGWPIVAASSSGYLFLLNDTWGSHLHCGAGAIERERYRLHMRLRVKRFQELAAMTHPHTNAGHMSRLHAARFVVSLRVGLPLTSAHPHRARGELR